MNLYLTHDSMYLNMTAPRWSQYRSRTVLQFGEENLDMEQVQSINTEWFYIELNDTGNNTDDLKDTLKNLPAVSARAKVNLPPKRKQQHEHYSNSAQSTSIISTYTDSTLNRTHAFFKKKKHQQQPAIDIEALLSKGFIYNIVIKHHHCLCFKQVDLRASMRVPTLTLAPSKHKQNNKKGKPRPITAAATLLTAEQTQTTISNAANHPSFPFSSTSSTPSSVAASAVVENPILASSSPYQKSNQKRSFLKKFVKCSSSCSSNPSSFNIENYTSVTFSTSASTTIISQQSSTMKTITDSAVKEHQVSTNNTNATTRFKSIFQRLRGGNNELVVADDQQKKKGSLHSRLVRSASFVGVISDRNSTSTFNSIAPENARTATTKNVSSNSASASPKSVLASRIKNKFRLQHHHYPPTKVHNTNYHPRRNQQNSRTCYSILSENDNDNGEIQNNGKGYDKRPKSNGFSIRRSASLSSLTQHFCSSTTLSRFSKKFPKAEEDEEDEKCISKAKYIGNRHPQNPYYSRAVALVPSVSTKLHVSHSTISFSSSTDSDDEEANEDRASTLNDIILGQQNACTKKINSVLGLKKSISSHKLYMDKYQQKQQQQNIQKSNNDQLLVDEGYFGGSNSSFNNTHHIVAAAPGRFVNNENVIDNAADTRDAVIKTRSATSPYYEIVRSVISNRENGRRGLVVSTTTVNTAQSVQRQASYLTTSTSISEHSHNNNNNFSSNLGGGGRPQQNKQIHRVRFMKLVMVKETFSKMDYDRSSDQNAVCTKLTPFIAEQIKEELNKFKLQEMKVHEFSRGNTQFFL
ncbi:hypothetical protein BDF20DRAFT_913307 [Mycotypha africana]|uniref:uncharacterized protein n=1 Tax=Mycotypha africana TaxID=64632 RepID=UPI002300A915|nr:uncharacterized protein BDF20DRAFT_913307 [Mycotypha africana]KAI8979799.1 hypothetical protein BDF20DRAFT_913307 [Mycotypha africana]